MAQQRLFDESDSDDDTSSVATDWTEQSVQKAVYPVDHILAEQTQDGKSKYLVKWAGYPEDRSTWEPLGNIGEATIEQWQEKSKAIERGYETQFYVQAWETEQVRIDQARERRWEKRFRKLAKLGRSIEPSKDHPAAQNSSSDREKSTLFVSPPRPIDASEGRKTTVSRSRVHNATNVRSSLKVRKSGAEIMAKFAEEPPPKRRRTATNDDKLYTNASHRWNVEKKAREGAVPNAEDIALALPGELHRISFSTAVKPRTEAKAAETSNPLTDTRRSSVEEEPLAPYAANVPLTCHYWASHVPCPEGERKCRFVHSTTQSIANLELHKQSREEGTGKMPKFFEPTEVCRFWGQKEQGCYHDNQCWFAHWYPINDNWIWDQNGPKNKQKPGKIQKTCAYWFNGHCKKSAEICQYIHEDLNAYATNLENQSIQKKNIRKVQKTCPFWLDGKCNTTAEECEFVHDKLDTVAHKSDKTCPFWLKGHCKKPAEECKFLHELRETVAYPPGGKYRAVPSESYFPPYDSYRPTNSVEYTLDTTPDKSRGEALSNLDFNKAMRSPSSYVQQLAKGAGADARARELSLASTPAKSNRDDAMNVNAINTNSLPGLKVFFKVTDQNTNFSAEIIGLSPDTMEMLKTDFSSIPEFVLSNMCLREMLHLFVLPLATTILSAGEIFDGDGQSIAQLADFLIEQRSAAIVKGPSSLVIIYPSHEASDWAFLGQPRSPSPTSQLFVQIRATEGSLQTMTLNPPSAEAPKSFEELLRQNHNLKQSTFFGWRGPEKIQKKVFIMAHPTSHRAEAEMLARYFREMGAEVWIPSPKGAWATFQTLGEGVIVFHPDFNRYGQVPNMHAVLLQRYNLFQFGIDWEDETPVRLTCKPIFTRGTCTFITDDMYVRHPKESLTIVQHIIKMNESAKDKASRTWSLYARPKLDVFLNRLGPAFLETDDEITSQARLGLMDAIEMLDEVPPGAPLYSSDFQSNFEETYRQDPVQAAHLLVDGFSVEVLDKAEQYRRWVVVHAPDAEPKKTLGEVDVGKQHLSFMTAEKFIRTFHV